MSLADECAAATAELTIPLLLRSNATEFADRPALTMLGDEDSTLTWGDLRRRVAAVSLGLADLGLRSGDRLLISASSRIEHWLVDLAAVHVGAVPGSAYATLSTPQLQYLADHSKATVLVIENAEQLARWSPVLGDLPEVRAIVLMDPTGVTFDDPRLTDLATVEAAGADRFAHDPSAFEEGWQHITPDHPVTLLYTSGTTGDPKGVVLSHRNVLHQAVAIELQVDTPAHAPTIGYLPLAHIAERVLGIYVPVYRAGHVHIVSDTAQAVAALLAVRPSTFFGVPRVWEKMVAALQGFLAAAEPAVQDAVNGASALALDCYRLREAGQPIPPETAEQLASLDALILKPIRAKLGLDNVTYAGSGAAPIPVEVLTFLAGIGVDVYEVWGMTETTGTATINTPSRFKLGTVGVPNVGMELKLAEDGEILVRGPLVCQGYLQADGSIQPVTDADGWLATGDIGTLDEDGFLTITDRKKELLITASGKNVAPAQIENLLRTHPLIGYAVAIGDRRPYVTALISLDEEAAPLWAAAHNIDASDPKALAEHPVVLAELQAAVDAANARLARPEQVKKFHVLPAALSPESGELTPTLKLKRRTISERHAGEIDDLYR
ncbi:AMP-dependent synthetase/ligase [Cryptosporangium aurantiacum]|uniref:Acyl-CoA synthetase n=1 Tax=Cryptosporangium aurantiacum TaxID=134849 RepID=A0A1M7RAS0_9ACTN|nr:AMP-dependent synthetase/ligase [Cryptosporangium aurantiacum]SHN43384.1 long-chain acyl-CoA synthetase [Cryptosporangium aurantiacum]